MRHSNKSPKDDKVNRFRGTSSSSSTAGLPSMPSLSLNSGGDSINSNSSSRRVFKSQPIAGANQQRVVTLLNDMKRYWRHRYNDVRRSTSDSGSVLPHHSSGKLKSSKAWHVDIPKRMVWSTAAVFLLLPLTLFYWKETHLASTSDEMESKITLTHTTGGGGASGHDVFPNWFADQEPPSNDDAEKEVPTENTKVDMLEETPLVMGDDDANLRNAPQPPQQDEVLPVSLDHTIDVSANNATHVVEAPPVELSKIQFVNDTQIPDNDPLSDPETAAKVGEEPNPVADEPPP